MSFITKKSISILSIVLILMSLSGRVLAQGYARFDRIVTTLATGTLTTPGGVAVDAAGTIYIAETGKHRILKYSGGTTTVLAGDGTAGFIDNQTGTGARFNTPIGIMVDGSANVYVADAGNNRIRRIDKSGLVTTVAGDGTAAILNYPSGVCQDASNNLYVTEYLGNKIRKVTLAGVVTTFSGTGVAGYIQGGTTVARYNAPIGITIDKSTGNLYVADANNGVIRMVTSAGVASTFSGTGTNGYFDGSATTSQFNKPYGVAFESTGYVLVADYNNNRIRSTIGNTSTIAGSTSGNVDGSVTLSKFNLPSGVAIQPSTTNYIVADQGNNTIRKISDQGALVFSSTYGTASQAQTVYVSSSGTNLTASVPAGFEVSTSLTGTYSSTVTVSAGSTSAAPVYVRVAANAAVNSYSGVLTIANSYQTQTLGISAVVSKASQTITFTTPSAVIYGTAPATLTGTSTSGLPITYSSTNTAVATVSGNTLTYVGVGNTSIVASQAGNASYNAAGSVAVAVIVNKASQTINFSTATSVDYGAKPAILTGTASSGLTVTYTSSNPAVATISGNQLVYVGGGTTTIVASQAGNATYNAAKAVSVTVVVNKISQTIDFPTPADRTYGIDATFDYTATASSGLPVTYTSSDPAIVSISGSTATIHGAGAVTITASQDGNNNYSPALTVNQYQVVKKRTQSVGFTVLPNNVVYGSAPLTLSATAQFGGPVTFTSSDPTVATVSGNILTIVGVGKSTITATQAGDSNYEPASVVQILNVSKADQDITFDVLSDKTLGDAPITLAATASSGLAVTYSSSDPTVATVSGNVLKFVAIGPVTITASQAGDVNYNAATDISHSFKVKPAQTISFDNIPNKIYGDVPFKLASTTDQGLNIIYTSADTNIAKVSGNTVIIKGIGTTTITATQPGDGTYGTATPVSHTFTVERPNVSAEIKGASIVGVGEAKEYRIVTAQASPQTYYYDWFYVKNMVFTPALTDINNLNNSTGEKVHVSFPSDFAGSRLAAVVSFKNTTGDYIRIDTVYYDVTVSKQVIPKVNCTDSLGCTAYKITSFEYAGVTLNQKAKGIECPAESFGYSNFATGQYVYDSLGSSGKLSLKTPELFTSAEMYVIIQGETQPQYYGFWLDADANGSFGDPGEFLGATKTPQLIYEGKIAIPNSSSQSGTRRLRVKCSNAPLEAASYCIFAANRLGETEDYLINLEPYPELKAPEAFTPGNDGFNDVFIIRGIDPARSEKSLKIYDQFSREVYAQDDYDNRWAGIGSSGEILPNGTYYYEFKNGDRKINGFIELVSEGTVK